MVTRSTYPLLVSKKGGNIDMFDVAWNPEQPYNTLPAIPNVEELETKAVLKWCITARVALAELHRAAELIPNPSVLINTLPLLEAQASSEVENIVTTADALFRHLEVEAGADPATKEALRYRQALMDGFQSLGDRPIGTGMAEAICGQIKDREMRVRRVPGTTLQNQATGEIIYTPPVGESRIRDLLAGWERFLHALNESDPLVRMAAAHYQFEAIHPFTDGNGRTGRILNSLYLVEQGLLTLPILYLSRYIISNKQEYHRRLLDVTREGDWESWLLYMLKGVEDTSRWTLGKIASIRKLQEHTTDFVRGRLPKIYSHELIDMIFEQPYCRISKLEKAGIAKRQTASRYLHELTGLGVLESRKVGREILFVHRKLMRLLTTDSIDLEEYS